MNNKRTCDLVLSIPGLLLLSPLLAAIAGCILVTSGPSVLFTQTRLCRNKKPFRIYKFRTMREADVTRIGNWLRETRLDQLPQILNVLGGEMSIVGPRPLTAADTQRLGWDRLFAQFRWQAAPGITGLAQLYGGNGAAESLKSDAQYLDNRSLADAKITLLSLMVNVIGKCLVRRILSAEQ